MHAIVERPGHSTIKFIDVGGKFVDLDDRLARLKAAKHRAQVRQKRRARPLQAAKKPEAAVAAHHKAVFDDSKVTVIFVLGGPGAGENCPHASGRKHKRY